MRPSSVTAVGSHRDAVAREREDESLKRLSPWDGALFLFLSGGLFACGGVRSVEARYMEDSRGVALLLSQEAWHVIPTDGPVLTLRHVRDAATVSFFVTCDPAEQLPLPRAAKRLFFGIRSKETLEQAPVQINGSAALRTILRGRFGEDEVQVASYVIRDGECVVDFVYIAPPDRFAEHLSEFEGFVRGWTPRSPAL